MATCLECEGRMRVQRLEDGTPGWVCQRCVWCPQCDQARVAHISRQFDALNRAMEQERKRLQEKEEMT